MQDNQWDKIIEKGIKDVSMEVEIRQPVMERIGSYERRKAKKPGIFTVLIYIYTFIASLFSFFFFNQLAIQYDSLFQKFHISISSLTLMSQGIFAFILVTLIIMAIYSRPWRKQPGSTTLIL